MEVANCGVPQFRYSSKGMMPEAKIKLLHLHVKSSSPPLRCSNTSWHLRLLLFVLSFYLIPVAICNRRHIGCLQMIRRKSPLCMGLSTSRILEKFNIVHTTPIACITLGIKRYGALPIRHIDVIDFHGRPIGIHRNVNAHLATAKICGHNLNRECQVLSCRCSQGY